MPILALIVAALLIRTFLYQPFNAPSESMAPSIEAGDVFLVSKIAFKAVAPRRGDVVVFYVPAMRNYFVKRIVGLPGEKIAMRNGLLLVNGLPAALHWVGRFKPERCSRGTCPSSVYDEILPVGRHHFALELASASPLDNTETFLVPANSYFVLGDNRRNSDDSRAELGFIPRAQILGRADFKIKVHDRWTWLTVQ